MSNPSSGGVPPVSPRMTKAAFFRARSPAGPVSPVGLSPTGAGAGPGAGIRGDGMGMYGPGGGRGEGLNQRFGEMRINTSQPLPQHQHPHQYQQQNQQPMGGPGPSRRYPDEMPMPPRENGFQSSSISPTTSLGGGAENRIPRPQPQPQPQLQIRNLDERQTQTSPTNTIPPEISPRVPPKPLPISTNGKEKAVKGFIPSSSPSTLSPQSTMRSHRTYGGVTASSHMPEEDGDGDEGTEVGMNRGRSTSGSGTATGTESLDHPMSLSTTTSVGAGSDEMMLTLLAGQAAVDCERLPIGGWEEVEAWKKELSLLATRLDSLEARHQREMKILNAARKLQKLNDANKRMSKQTMESLEQSEKRADAAEKDVLVLRDREAALRQRLMEHWSGVMAWEVRRLERVSSEAQARYSRQAQFVTTAKQRESELTSRIESLENETKRKVGRVEELEEMVVEMGRRERAVEEELKELDKAKSALEREKAGWTEERKGHDMRKEHWLAETRGFERERDAWTKEKRMFVEERQNLLGERDKALTSGQMSSQDRATFDQIRSGLGGILGRKSGTVAETEMVAALQEVKALVGRREKEAVSLRDEMREVNHGLEDELRRVSQDRDLWKSKAERGDQGKQAELSALERRLRSQGEQISDLTLRNESLSTSLAAAQSAVSSMSSSSQSTKTLQTRVDALTAELDSIAGQFTEVWSLLPSPSRRVDAELVDRAGSSNISLKSPSKLVNFAALQQLYMPTNEQFAGIDEMLNRIRGMVDDGKVLSERVVRLGQERELHKNNAAKAKKLVEDSTKGLETYQQQVAVLEDRLAKSNAGESRLLEELNSLRLNLESTTSTKRTLETRSQSQKEALDRLTEVNDSLSARALTMAEDAEKERVGISKRWQDEVETLKRQLEEVQEEADEQRSRGQAQRIQLLDELNSLQAEVGELRKQLRAAKGGK